MAHMRHAKTIMEMTNCPRPEHKTTKPSEREIKFGKMLRKLDQQLAGRKIEIDKDTGYPIPNDLREEGEKAYQEMIARKESYQRAKHEGKLWTRGQKEASREAKRVARREARLAKKLATVAS